MEVTVTELNSAKKDARQDLFNRLNRPANKFGLGDKVNNAVLFTGENKKSRSLIFYYRAVSGQVIFHIKDYDSLPELLQHNHITLTPVVLVYRYASEEDLLSLIKSLYAERKTADADIITIRYNINVLARDLRRTRNCGKSRGLPNASRKFC